MNKQEKDNFKNDLKVDNIQDFHAFIQEKTFELADAYQFGTSYEAKEYMCHLVAGIYLTYRKLYPELCNYIPFREKSFDSFRKNVNKENNIQVSEFNGFSVEEFEEHYDSEKITSDINALTVVLDHINPTKQKHADYLTPEIKHLLVKGLESEFLVSELDSLLSETVYINVKEYYDYKIKLLDLLVDLHFSEFSYDRTMTYEEELNRIKETYQQKISENSLATDNQLEDLKILCNDLRHIMYDKCQYLILQETFPNVINQPLLKHFLKVSATFGKDIRKSNKYASTYYYLDTPFGRIETQLQSSEGYYQAKKGSAAHSLYKTLNLDELFELTNPDDEKPLEYYLNILNRTPVSNIRHDIIKPTFNTPEEEHNFYSSEIGKQYMRSEQLKELQSHIKLKDYYTYESAIIGTNETQIQKVPIDTIILSKAEACSPYMSVCSSAHTNYSTASIHHKNLISEFSEVLRQKDSMTCSGDIVIHRLKEIVEDPTIAYQGLPKELSERDIINYGLSKFHNKDNEDIEKC